MLRTNVYAVCTLTLVHVVTKLMTYCKTRFVRVPFISRLWQPWRHRKNNRPQIFEITPFTSTYPTESNKNAKIKGDKII